LLLVEGFTCNKWNVRRVRCSTRCRTYAMSGFAAKCNRAHEPDAELVC
jgi:hypothetical protein